MNKPLEERLVELLETGNTKIEIDEIEKVLEVLEIIFEKPCTYTLKGEDDYEISFKLEE